ncbi:hypothetical protein C0J50_7137 [Silurus asotus]|uniref:Secreted protein n=1 Tax=Silurus asotus TaxID=30991 RepID=A0AAD4ZZC6_SILAS|nr:hypothetical protein C0J50_7137 [Silurus asotus]
MLSRNLVVASIAIVFLATAVSAAPVEDKEPEENDFEAEEGEEELSEEEEDDDDSKGQHMKGAGAQQATKVPKGPGESQAVHHGSQIEAPGSESILENPETGSETETNGGIGDGFSPDPYTDTIGMALDLTDAPSDVMPNCLINNAVSADHMGLNFQVESTVTSDNGAQLGSPGDTTEAADNNGADSPNINAETLNVIYPTASPVTKIPWYESTGVTEGIANHTGNQCTFNMRNDGSVQPHMQLFHHSIVLLNCRFCD